MDYAQRGPLKHTCLCFYVGEITPPQELSCACLLLAHFSSNSVCPDLFAPVLPFARGDLLSLSLFYYQTSLDSEPVVKFISFLVLGQVEKHNNNSLSGY